MTLEPDSALVGLVRLMCDQLGPERAVLDVLGALETVVRDLPTVPPVAAALPAPSVTLPAPSVTLPAPHRAPDLGGLADVVADARDLEGLTRPLLDALHDLSGIASTYLTVVHADGDVQEIRYARNTKPGFALPEGIEVPWAGHAVQARPRRGTGLHHRRAAVWGDSQAAADLGIVTYVSVPVRLSDGRRLGHALRRRRRRARRRRHPPDDAAPVRPAHRRRGRADAVVQEPATGPPPPAATPTPTR